MFYEYFALSIDNSKLYILEFLLDVTVKYLTCFLYKSMLASDE